MTQQDDITQPVLTDDDLLRICQQFNPGQDLDLAKAVRDAVLSKLRAPVAEPAIVGWRDPDCGRMAQKGPPHGWHRYSEALMTVVEHRALMAAALASSPVAKPLPEHFKPPFDNCSFRMCDLPGQCRGKGKCHHPASAPVAGEAQSPIGYVDPVYVAGRQRGMPWNAKIYDTPNQEATAPLYAAPQASADAVIPASDVRNAALEEAAQTAYKALFPTSDRSDWTEFAESAAYHAELAAQCIRALKQPQADKDGAEQAFKDLMTHGVSIQRGAPAGFLADRQQRAEQGDSKP
ncbi:MAG: hypothetical protein ACN6O8_20265 [Achromobacter sp.]|uniref:hypothetical protein n=1 Tax=Achromobacter sp. TaxID=134375 RepID=UPI003CFF5063